MVSSSSATPSLSYANRTKLIKSTSTSNSPTPSSTSTTDVEKQPDDALSGSLVNGLSVSSGPAPNVWATRQSQMAARTQPPAAVGAGASSSSSPTLAASPSLPTNTNGGVDLSSWPQVAAASTPVKDKADRVTAKEPTTPTPKKNEKKKWVPIPPTELQAAADAVTRGRSSPKHASAAPSAHSSPKFSSRGRRLNNDDTSRDVSRRSPSRLTTHAYTHPMNSPSRPSSSFVLPAPASHPEPHHPPLTLQKRPLSPASSGPVAGYRDIDDLKLGQGRLVMFGSIGASSASVGSSPSHRGLGLDIGGVDYDRRRQEEAWDISKRVGGGFAIGLSPGELERTMTNKAARRRSAPAKLALSPEIVDLTDGAWLGDVIGGRSEDTGAHERKWEFGTSRHSPDEVLPSHLSAQVFHPPPPPQMYPPLPPPNFGMYPPPPGPPMGVNIPESALGDFVEYDTRGYMYGEPYVGDRERRGGFAGSSRRGRYAGSRGGPNGNAGRGFGGRRGGPSNQYAAPPPGAYPPASYPPPPPPPGPDGYYMGPPYNLPYPPYAPPPIPPYPVPPMVDPSGMRPGPMSAPVPMPVTMTHFPIDPTRWYLLGQLEYYFSVQNLVTDYWLRKQMDRCGWVPISVIASFNRVRNLTFDVALVKDVLGLSALVEVFGDKVRLRDRRWEPFILPDAPESDIPELREPQQLQPSQLVGEISHASQDEAADDEGEEEEDVVFVMGREGEERRSANAQWSPSQGVEQQPRS